MKEKRKGILKFCLCCLVFDLGLIGRAAEVKAEGSVAFLYMAPTEKGDSTAVVVAMEESGIQDAVLSWSAGRVSAKKIEGPYLTFLLPGGNVKESQLGTLNIQGNHGTYEVSLRDFLKASGTEIVKDPEPPAIGNSRSRGGSQELNKAQERTVESYTAKDGNGISGVLSMAETGVGSSRSRAGDIVIVLDPGHGGWEAGAYRTWDGVDYIEKDITLKISKYTKKELEKYEGVKVYLTRSTDKYLDLAARVDFAASKGATALISQHINSTAKQQDKVSGAMVFVASGNYRPDLKGENWALAQTILNTLKELGLKDLGLVVEMSHTGDTYEDGSLADYYGIIRRSVIAGFPGIIVEHGFVNNPADCVKYYGKESTIKKMGMKDAKAIAQYYGLKKRSTSGSTFVEGWQEENGRYFYQYADGTRAESGWLTVEGQTYYLDYQGYRFSGLVEIQGKSYYFDENGVRKAGLISYNNGLYWANTQGMIRHGWFKGFDGNRYYSDTDGRLKTGFAERKGKTYYFDPSTGAMKIGIQNIDGKFYYFYKSGMMSHSGWKRIGTARYYFHKDGHAQQGLFSDKGERYFFSLKNGQMVKKKWIRYRGRWYYAAKSGTLLRSTSRYLGRKKYQFNSKGVYLNRG